MTKHTPNAIEKFAKRVRVTKQGKFIVEADGAGGFFCMSPDGDIWAFGSKRDVQKHIAAWFKDHLESDIGLGEIEWRDA